MVALLETYFGFVIIFKLLAMICYKKQTKDTTIGFMLVVAKPHL